MSNFTKEQQVKAMRKYGTVKSDSDYKKDESSLYYSTKEIVSDTIIATAEWSKKMLKDYGLDDEFTDNEIDELIRQAKESK